MCTPLNGENCGETIAATDQGMILCSRKLCPHCKNMEKALEKFSVQRPAASLFKLDSEEEPGAMAALGVERVPTLLVVKNGKVSAVKTGLMNPRELVEFYDRSL